MGDGPKWQQDWGLIGNNPGVGLRPRNTDARIDSQMFVLQGNDENIHPSDLDGEGDLNADYAVRVNKFLAAYQKTPAPAAGNGDHAFKGYEAFDPKVTLGNCGKFPYGYVGKKVTPCIFFKLNNIWGWEPKPVKCATNNDALEPEIDAEDGLPKDLCPDSLKEHMNSAAGKGVVDDSIFIDCRGRNVADQEALADRSPTSQRPGRCPSSTSPTWARGTKSTRRLATTLPLWPSRWTPPPRASWCTWSAAPTTAASSTTRRTSLVSSNSKSKSCKERSSAQLQIQLLADFV